MWDKIEMVAREFMALGRHTTDAVRTQIDAFEAAGSATYQFHGKNTSKFSDDPKLLGAPEGHDLTVREVRLLLAQDAWSRSAAAY